LSFHQRLAAAFNVLRGKPLEYPKIYASKIGYLTGVYPKIDFETCRKWFLKDTTLQYHCEYFRDAVVGSGFYIRAEDPDAVTDLNDFCEDVNLDGVLQESVLQMAYAGNLLTHKKIPNNIENLYIVPITTIKNMYVDPKTVIHWKWGMDNDEPFGPGLIRPLLESRQVTLKYSTGETETVTIPPWCELKALIENDMPIAFRKWVRFKTIFTPEPGAPIKPGWSEEHGKKLTSGLEDVAIEAPIKPQSIKVEPRRGFEPIMDYIENRIFEGCKNPVGRLFTSPGFTEASARVALLLGDRKISAFQRQVKRTVEREIFTPVLTQNGYDPKKVRARIYWNPSDKMDVTLADLIKLAYPTQPNLPEQGTYTPVIDEEELREILAKSGGLDLQPKEETEGGEE